MKIKRLIALSAMAAALASGAALAQDNHYDGSWHHPAAWQDQRPSLVNHKKDSREEQIRKQRERDEKIRKQREKEEKKRIEREKKERQRAEANRKKKKPNFNNQNQQNWPHF